MGLRFFKRGNKYTGVSDALHSIRQEFEAIWSKIDNYAAPEDSVSSEQNSYIPEINAQADTQYKGMFKIERVTNADGTWRLHVYDTYGDPRHRLAGQCMVNNYIMDVSEWESENYNSGSGTILVLLHYTFIDGVSAVTVTSSIEAGIGSIYPTASNTEAWYLLGRVTDDSIQQDHLGGMPQILWFYRCEDE